MGNIAGRYRISLPDETANNSFVPRHLPPTPPIKLADDTIGSFVKTDSRLAVLKNAAALIPKAEPPVSLYMRKERIISPQPGDTRTALRGIPDPLQKGNDV